MKNVRLILSYIGTSYLGWQKTKMGPSIEQTLEAALETILQKVTLQAAAERMQECMQRDKSSIF